MLGILKLPYQDNLPEQVIETYGLIKIAADRVGIHLSDRDLLWIVIQSGVYVPGRERTISDLFKAGMIKSGDPVLCQWRKEKDKEAVLIDVTPAGEAIVRFPDKPDDVKLTADKVRPVEQLTAGA